MIAEERRTRILQIAESSGFVSLQQIVAELGASESTVRRDLEHLDAQGQIQRTRGGAAFVGETTEAEFPAVSSSAEKRQIARHVAATLLPHQTVLLDGGTTTLEVARALPPRPLQVVTNSLPIASLLMNRSEIELIFVGGYVYPRTGVALGDQAVDALRTVNVDRLIMGTGGITADGLFNSNALLVETERQMLRAADEITVVADDGKFGHRALCHLCPLEAVGRIVTNRSPGEEWEAVWSAAGVELEIAGTESAGISGK